LEVFTSFMELLSYQIICTETATGVVRAIV
jgi:hypothetical protein